jgi:glycerophosphoryl diester phosphodiesterase
LELLETTALLVNVEIKALPRLYPAITTHVLDCLGHYGMRARTLLSSFDHEQLVTARALDAQLATAVLSSDRLAKPADYLALLDADAYHPSCHGEQDSLGFNSVQGKLQRGGITAVRAVGKAVNPWTCNQPEQMRELRTAGVTGIFTDYPNRLAAVAAEQ